MLRFRDTKLVERFLDLGRHFFPCFPLLLGRFYIVLNVVEIEVFHIAAPFRHRHFQELIERFQTKFEHPFRLVLHAGNLGDDFARQPFTALEDRFVLVAKPIFVLFHFRHFFLPWLSSLL